MSVYSKLVSASLTLSLLALSSAYAGMYRWVDEDGVTHYTQTPPINEESTLIEEPKPPTTPSDEAWKKLNKQRSQQQSSRETRAQKKEEQKKLAEEKEIKEQNCEAARKNLAILQNGPPTRRMKTASGEYVRLTEEDYQQKVDEARDNIKEFCD
jgi:flagellar biosynthesis GTPase FlhF